MILKQAAFEDAQRHAFKPENYIYERGPLSETIRRELGEPLDQGGLIEASLACFELQRAGFLALNPVQVSGHPGFKITPAGTAFLASAGTTIFQAVGMDELIIDQVILERSWPNFSRGDFDAAVMLAFKAVEEELRAKAGLAASVIGVELVKEALNPANGVLVDPTAQTDAERDAVHLLFRGAVGMFRNPSAHRTVPYDNAKRALQAIGFADMLLGVIARLQRRT